ncbi:hypothetical protein BIM11_6191 [Burkholderia pseudomallei]|nr:hypothetical protein BIM11_6191 [Burkholderia pseudomallei]
MKAGMLGRRRRFAMCRLSERAKDRGPSSSRGRRRPRGWRCAPPAPIRSRPAAAPALPRRPPALLGRSPGRAAPHGGGCRRHRRALVRVLKFDV